MRVVDDFAVGKLAHLVADRFQRIVETAVADGRGVAVADQFDQPRAVFRRIARGDQRVDLRRHPRGSRGGRETQVGRAARSRSGSSECRPGSGRGIRRDRCEPAVLRSHQAVPPRSAVRHRRPTGAPPRRRLRARTGRGSRAVRDRAARARRPSITTRSRTLTVASASSESAVSAAARADVTRPSAGLRRWAACGMTGVPLLGRRANPSVQRTIFPRN